MELASAALAGAGLAGAGLAVALTASVSYLMRPEGLTVLDDPANSTVEYGSFHSPLSTRSGVRSKEVLLTNLF